MCFFKTPKAPPPPPPASSQEQALQERKRLALRKGHYISPFALAGSSGGGAANPTPVKTLLGG